VGAIERRSEYPSIAAYLPVCLPTPPSSLSYSK
jgi:hypothetical protein